MTYESHRQLMRETDREVITPPPEKEKSQAAIATWDFLYSLEAKIREQT
jgi:hypothetical protein